MRSKDPKDVEESLKGVVRYIKDDLQYEVYEVAHVATGKKHVKGRKEVNLTDSEEKQGMCPSEEWKEKGQKIEKIGHMCENTQKERTRNLRQKGARTS